MTAEVSSGSEPIAQLGMQFHNNGHTSNVEVEPMLYYNPDTCTDVALWHQMRIETTRHRNGRITRKTRHHYFLRDKHDPRIPQGTTEIIFIDGKPVIGCKVLALPPNQHLQLSKTPHSSITNSWYSDYPDGYGL